MSLFQWRLTPVGKTISESERSLKIVFWFTFLAEVLSLAPIVYMINLFDRVVSSRSMTTLVSLTVMVIAVFIFWGAIEWIRSRLMVRLSLRLDWDLAPDIFDATFRAHLGKKNLNIQQLLTDLLEFRQFLTGAPMLALMAVPFAFIFVIVGAMIHPWLAGFVALAIVTLLFAAYANQKITGPLLREANDNFSEANRQANVFIKESETTYALGMLPAARRHWYKIHRQYLSMQVNASEATGLAGGFTSFLNRSFPSLAKALIAVLVLQSLVNPTFIFVGALLVMRAVQPLQQLLSSWSSVIKAKQAFDRLNLLLAEHSLQKETMPLPAPKGLLEVTDLVGVPPQSAKKVVDEINFSVKPGQAVAIVGISASGKSSLAKLLMGVWKPHSGSVRLDGVEISEWNHDELGPHIGYVPQEIAFFEGTIAENIARLGEVDSEKVVGAAKLVGMHEAILAFPDGYDTRIGDVNAFGLSGGQRQRLAIARAIYDSPKYVVMDEPNANLDEQGEQALVSAIQSLKNSGSTVLVTTHRPRLIGTVDSILVMRNCKQVMFGPAKQVINKIRNLQPVADTDGLDKGPDAPAKVSRLVESPLASVVGPGKASA